MKLAAGILLATGVMASCAEPPTPPSAEPAEPEPASITVSATYDQSTCCYVEGFIPVVRIVGSGVDVEKEFEIREAPVEVVLEVPRGGGYMLESWVEPCAGNCGARDPATDHCSASVTVADGDDLKVDLVIRSTHPCEITVGAE